MDEEASALAAAVDAELGAWVVRCVRRFTDDAATLAAAEVAAGTARAEVGDAVRRLLALDVDEQRITPLQLLRQAVRYPTAVLAAAGVPEVDRDDRDRELFPDDAYGLIPANFGDIGDRVGEAGIRWGAAKVLAHRRRHGGAP